MKVSKTLYKSYHNLYEELIKDNHLFLPHLIFQLSSGWIIEDELTDENDEALVIIAYINTICQTAFLKEIDLMMEDIVSANSFILENKKDKKCLVISMISI